jgi:hypothetical protein
MKIQMDKQNILSILFWNCLVVSLVLLPKVTYSQKQCNSLFPVKIGQKWGYINNQGKLTIPADFDFVWSFSQNRALIKQDGLLGIIDEQGKWIMRPEIKGYTLPMTEGTFLLVENGKYKFLDKNGNQLTQSFDQAFQIQEGLAAVKYSGKWGYIDRTGNVVISFQYDHANSFSEGLAQVNKDSKGFFINKIGQKVFEIAPKMSASNFSEGLARIEINDLYGFIDTTGKIVVQPEFPEAEDFTEGLARVSTQSSTYYGFINKSGEISIPPKYKDANPFSEGLASIKIGEKWGFINQRGQLVIPLKFDKAYNFECGIASVEINNKQGFINKKGNFIFNQGF